MELWRTTDRTVRPEVLGSRNLMIALGLHLAFLMLFWIYSIIDGLFDEDEDEIIPIDLTVVVNENLEGVENEPPPLKNPDPPPKPEPPKPKEKPVAKEPEKPKELEKIVTNIVAKVEKTEEPKPVKPEPPKKSAKELRDERIKRIRDSAKTVNKPVAIVVRNVKESGNGRTDKKTLSDAEIMKMLNANYKPGTSNQLAANEEQLGYSLIKQAFEAKWDKPPWTDTLRPMVIRVWFGSGGMVVNFKLESSSGDGKADQSIKTAASRVGAIRALPQKFIEKYRSSGVPVRFTVVPQ